MLTLKENVRTVAHWDLVFEYRAEAYRAYLSRKQGPIWHAGAVPSKLKGELEEWRWKEQELVDRLRGELPAIPLKLISEGLGNAGVREASLEAYKTGGSSIDLPRSSPKSVPDSAHGGPSRNAVASAIRASW